MSERNQKRMQTSATTSTHHQQLYSYWLSIVLSRTSCSHPPSPTQGHHSPSFLQHHSSPLFIGSLVYHAMILPSYKIFLLTPLAPTTYSLISLLVNLLMLQGTRTQPFVLPFVCPFPPFVKTHALKQPKITFLAFLSAQLSFQLIHATANSMFPFGCPTDIANIIR